MGGESHQDILKKLKTALLMNPWGALRQDTAQMGPQRVSDTHGDQKTVPGRQEGRGDNQGSKLLRSLWRKVSEVPAQGTSRAPRGAFRAFGMVF